MRSAARALPAGSRSCVRERYTVVGDGAIRRPEGDRSEADAIGGTMTPPNPPSARARRTNMLLFVACVAIWSTSWIAITTQVATTPPVTSLFWRFAVAFAALVVVERI